MCTQSTTQIVHAHHAFSAVSQDFTILTLRHGSPMRRTSYCAIMAEHSFPPAVFVKQIMKRQSATSQSPCISLNGKGKHQNPLKSIKTVSEYGTLLLKVFVMPYFQSHCTEVHLCFDNPKQQQFNPKQCEQERRDEACKTDLESHTHLMFTPHTTIPRPWQEYVYCRQCKRALIEALGSSYLQTARFGLYPGKKLVLSGCFSGNAENTAWVIAEGSLPQPEPMYSSSAQEADMNMWRYVIQSPAHCILVYSPDTDVYNIGLTLIQCTSAEVIVQNNVPHKEKRYLNLNSLFTALANDPDLAALPVDKLGNIMQTLYIC